MVRSIANDIRHQFQSGNMITRLIIVNVVLFLIIMLFKLVLTLGQGFEEGGMSTHIIYMNVVKYLCLSSDLLWDAKHPWTIFTYMFTHEGVMHILFNMLILYWFGRIAGDLLGDHRMLPLYLYSGLAGALVYLITAPMIYSGETQLLGASGAVMGIVAAAAMTAPDYQMRLLFLGDVRLKYIFVGLLVLDLIAIANLGNVGGHMAHLGGAAFGLLYVRMLRQGIDMTSGFQRLMRLFDRPTRRPHPPVRRRVPLEIRHRSQVSTSASSMVVPDGGQDEDNQDRLDAILDKIKRSGMSSLSEEEKQFLHEASKK